MAKVEQAKDELTVYLPDTRGVVISPYGKGNTKIGPDIYTYSRLPGRIGGTCPGATPLCQDCCYAMRVIKTPPVWEMWTRNSQTGIVPPLPPDAKIVRWHVGGDFDTPYYVQQWCRIVEQNPGVLFFGYTRSWAVPELLPALMRLQKLPNVQLFASMDEDTQEMPPQGWRRAWLGNDLRAMTTVIGGHLWYTLDGQAAYTCSEETGERANCQECGYCFRGKRNDVIFILR